MALVSILVSMPTGLSRGAGMRRGSKPEKRRAIREIKRAEEQRLALMHHRAMRQLRGRLGGWKGESSPSYLSYFNPRLPPLFMGSLGSLSLRLLFLFFSAFPDPSAGLWSSKDTRSFPPRVHPLFLDTRFFLITYCIYSASSDQDLPSRQYTLHLLIFLILLLFPILVS